jgi:hypothetical protein
MRALVRGMTLAAVVIMFSPATANSTSALQMASNCKPVEEANIGDEKMHFSGKPHMGIGVCLGFFEAVQSASSVSWTGRKHPALFICGPPSSSLSQYILVFQKYVREHPEMGHKNAFDIALSALHTAFPCKG